MATTTIERNRPAIRESETYDMIRELIVLGQLAPGGRIIESDLVERLGVDRKTVRTAIQRLEQEDLVAKLPGGRARWAVSPLTIDDIRELHEITAELEGLAGRRAATLDEEARQRLVDQLESINDELRKLADSESPLNSHRVADLESAFHCTIVDVAGGRRLRKICHSLKPQAARYAYAYTAFLIPAASALAGAHTAIVEAIQRGDGDAADRAIQEYLAAGADNYAEVMETVGERGTW
jgi:GntR family transcriptional regulator of vanillate catabolism